MSTIRREIAIAAPAVTVFEYFIDPDKMTQWMGVRANLDARPGGDFRVDITGGDVARGTYLAVERPSRVVFTWGWEGDGNPVPPGSSEVEVTLREVGGRTHVSIEHRGLPDGDEGHADGWDHYLERLTSAGGGADPGPDPWVGART